MKNQQKADPTGAEIPIAEVNKLLVFISASAKVFCDGNDQHEKADLHFASNSSLNIQSDIFRSGYNNNHSIPTVTPLRLFCVHTPSARVYQL